MSRTKLTLMAMMASSLMFAACGTDEMDEALDQDGLEGKADSAAKVKVTTDKAQYGLTDPINVTITNKYLATTIYVGGCNASSLEQKVNGKWQFAGVDKVCFWEGVARKLVPGDKTSDVYSTKPAGTYRVKVGYKTTCQANQPLSACNGTQKTVYSAQFTVGSTGICTNDAQCGKKEYCKFADGACKAKTFNLMTGKCEVKPQACYQIIMPVCGCDDKTYGNACFAASAGVSINHTGPCEAAKPKCDELGGYCLPLTNPANQPTCKAGEYADTTLGCGGLLGQSTTCCLPKAACWGAWVDQNGNCRGPADGVLPDGCCTALKHQACLDLDAKYAAAVTQAKKCSPYPTFAPQCTFTVKATLTCGCPTAVNSSPTTGDVKLYTDQWAQLGCDQIGWLCPALACPQPLHSCEVGASVCN